MKQFIAALLLAWMPGAMSAAPMEDVDYVLIPPQPVLAPGRIEVIEFFYYGCESCKRLEPQLQPIVDGLIDKVRAIRKLE